MKFASRIAGHATDTSRDHDYTDWFAVDAFADEFVNIIDRCARKSAIAS